MTLISTSERRNPPRTIKTMGGTRAPLRSAPRTRAFIPPAAPRQQSEYCRLARGSVANPANDGNASSQQFSSRMRFLSTCSSRSSCHESAAVRTCRNLRSARARPPFTARGSERGPARSPGHSDPGRGRCPPRESLTDVYSCHSKLGDGAREAGPVHPPASRQGSPDPDAGPRLERSVSSWLTAFEPGSRLREVAGSRPVAPTHQL